MIKSSLSRCINALIFIVAAASPVKAGFDDVWQARIAREPVEIGIASIYRDRRTASGERFDGKALTCAHRSRPLCTAAEARLGVCPARSFIAVRHAGRTVECRVNDRGPYKAGRIIDLSSATAEALGLSWKQGLGRVELK